jgi:E3 ubiquitin-protein ligase DOA10
LRRYDGSAEAAMPSDAVMIMVGYLVALLCTLITVSVVVVLRSTNGFGFATLGAFAHDISRIFGNSAVMLKVTVLLSIELISFPIMSGTIVDFCSVHVFENTTTASRLDFAKSRPLLSLLVHWLLGFMYMFSLSTFVQVLREFVRPEVLYFVRNPDDPDFHPFRDLVVVSCDATFLVVCASLTFYTLVHASRMFILLCIFRFDFFNRSGSNSEAHSSTVYDGLLLRHIALANIVCPHKGQTHLLSPLFCAFFLFLFVAMNHFRISHCTFLVL